MNAAKSSNGSQSVRQKSHALTLRAGVFNQDEPKAIARSLKAAADASKQRNSDAFCSAMSMLTFYINRAGQHLPARRRRILQAAKDELRGLYGRPRRY
ncbi:DUF3175 domain-containing protein [Microbulbifer sp. OS29]|uniref:DUF3175 domain-containing protein n=1 Tax=Microbulbifer okhotskensis TaxID=2926617 RepID=A0A9X2J5X3_9GAMM|nr:DUF3175 domain-containing protein [Microbulbifer okhotskensis]MCO1334035.1 DUF3175 domain-containing protein [Microbulbifer okhotskensis]